MNGSRAGWPFVSLRSREPTTIVFSNCVRIDEYEASMSVPTRVPSSTTINTTTTATVCTSSIHVVFVLAVGGFFSSST